MNGYHTKTKSLRPLMLLGFLLTTSMFAAALFMQHVWELDPCPLCIVTRFVVIAFIVFFLFGLIVNPVSWGRRFLGLFFTLTSFTGIIVSGRHSWLQHFPPEAEVSCGFGLSHWMDTLPAQEVIQNVFKGTAECATKSFDFYGLSIPEINLIIFIGFLFFSLRLLFKGR